MKINLEYSIFTIEKMKNWLYNSKKSGIRDKNELQEILKLNDYKIEFERYSLPNLPVCGIS